MDSSASIILAVAIMVIMMGMGLSLTIADFKRVAQYPKPVLLGLTNQIILLPLVSLGLIYLFQPPAFIAIGMILLAACPGGTSSNLVTLLAKGDLALSVSMTAINSIITIVTIPFWVGYAYTTYLAEASSMSSPTADIFKTLIVVLAIPLSVGMLIKNRAPQFADRMERPVRIASSVFLALVILGLLAREFDLFQQYVGDTLAIVAALNAITMGLGYVLAKAFGLNLKQGLTIAIESGIQNGTLTISLAVITLNQPDFAIIAAIYSLVMYAFSSVPIYFGLKASK
ncbi:bile acid:sodium symporter family protein [Flavobacteriaceae bacterium]|nr:bile acid:sodium symporter family protein [Flavobacteriaceae bacterium]